MAVSVQNANVGINGHAQAVGAFRRAHTENSAALVNHMNGVEELETPLPPYNPTHPDNQWPLMVYHPVKGELTVGQSLLQPVRDEKAGVVVMKPIADYAARKRITEANSKALDAALKAGYRKEPYPKTQIAVMDPASEKLAMKAELDKKAGEIATQQDLLNKLEARLALLEKGPAVPEKDPAE